MLSKDIGGDDIHDEAMYETEVYEATDEQQADLDEVCYFNLMLFYYSLCNSLYLVLQIMKGIFYDYCK